MRTLILILVVAIVVAVGVAFAFGMLSVTTERSDGQYVLTLTVNTSTLNPTIKHELEEAGHGDVKGKITTIDPEKQTFVVSSGEKSWNFELAKDGKITINDRESKLADLRSGDEADVSYERHGEEIIATTVRTARNP